MLCFGIDPILYPFFGLQRRMIGGQEGLFPNTRNENEVISCKLENVLKRDGLEEHNLLSCITQATSRML
jgi:hypothetical protein